MRQALDQLADQRRREAGVQQLLRQLRLARLALQLFHEGQCAETLFDEAAHRAQLAHHLDLVAVRRQALRIRRGAAHVRRDVAWRRQLMSGPAAVSGSRTSSRSTGTLRAAGAARACAAAWRARAASIGATTGGSVRTGSPRPRRPSALRGA
jgi:hypothetical protein